MSASEDASLGGSAVRIAIPSEGTLLATILLAFLLLHILAGAMLPNGAATPIADDAAVSLSSFD